MSPSPVAPPPAAAATAEPRDRRWLVLLETWGLSVLFHTALLVVFGLVWQTAAKPAGRSDEPLRTVELVTRRNTPDGPQYVDRDQARAEAAAVATQAEAAGKIDVPSLLGDAAASPVDLQTALPKAVDVAGLGLGDGRPMLGGGGLLSGPAVKGTPTAGRASTSVYGLRGEGFKFVYVFDRSGSMGGSGNRALNAAKAELLRSLDDLGETHQFQIIFYNEQPIIMQLGGSANLMLGTKANKEAARKFVAGISADGATAHEPALTLALRLNPDVVFFLTDADQPELSPAQLDRIKKLNGARAVVNTIEFGLGPKIRKENFLDRVAAENGGRSVYVDISGR